MRSTIDMAREPKTFCLFSCVSSLFRFGSCKHFALYGSQLARGDFSFDATFTTTSSTLYLENLKLSAREIIFKFFKASLFLFGHFSTEKKVVNF